MAKSLGLYIGLQKRKVTIKCEAQSFEIESSYQKRACKNFEAQRAQIELGINPA